MQKDEAKLLRSLILPFFVSFSSLSSQIHLEIVRACSPHFKLKAQSFDIMIKSFENVLFFHFTSVLNYCIYFTLQKYNKFFYIYSQFWFFIFTFFCHKKRIFAKNEEARDFLPAIQQFCYFLSLFRSLSSRTIFLRRIACGVNSTYSSSLIYSRACSRLKITGGAKWALSSLPEARTLVSFLDLVTFTTKSPSLVCSPTICPA